MGLGGKVKSKVRRALRLGALLAAEGNPVAAMQWLILSAIGIKKELRIKVGGVPVTIRTSSSDLDVSLVSLRGEFDDVFAAVPTLQHDLIVDAGGYIGTAAIAFARAYPNATIVTLEPSNDNFELLCRNTRRYSNIHPVNAALSSVKRQATLRDRGTGQSGFTVVEPTAGSRGDDVLHSVDCVTFADVVRDFDRDGADILKLDIEGGELAVLGGRPDWLASVGALCVELHDRIIVGCTDAYIAATTGRENISLDGEKFLSLHPDYAIAARRRE